MSKVFFGMIVALVVSSLSGCVEPRHTSEPVPKGSPQNVGDCTCSSLITCSCGSSTKP